MPEVWRVTLPTGRIKIRHEPPRELTEARVREIVRDELRRAARQAGRPLRSEDPAAPPARSPEIQSPTEGTREHHKRSG